MSPVADAQPGVTAYLQALARALACGTLDEARQHIAAHQSKLPPPCRQAGLALLQQAFAQREQASLRDPLTGCWNRAYLEHALDRALHEAHRHQTPGALLLIDLDHFKAVNQEHGHLSGDRILRAAAKGWSGQIRQNDTLGRWGGDEFYVILSDTRLDGAQQVAERLCRPIRQLAIPLTCSIGGALFPPDAPPDPARVVAVIDAADLALREAKKARNCARYNLL